MDSIGPFCSVHVQQVYEVKVVAPSRQFQRRLLGKVGGVDAEVWLSQQRGDDAEAGAGAVHGKVKSCPATLRVLRQPA